MDFVILTDHRVKIKENEKITNIWMSSENWKVMKYEGAGDADCSRSTWNGPLMLRKSAGRVGNRR